VHRIAVLDDYQYVAASYAQWSQLSEPVEVVEFADHVSDEDALVKRLAAFDVVIAMRERTPFPRSVLERLPNLKLLVTTGERNAAIDIKAAAELGITVSGTGYFSSGAAEMTWALILAVVRHIPEEDRSIRAGGWQQTIGTDLEGSTLGVIGLGRLGERVARVGLAFGMDVVGWSQNLTDERCAEVGVRRAGSKEELLEQADIVTVHTLLSRRTRGLIGRAEFERMKPSAILINTARGGVVDQAALRAALHAGTIAGAALDVTDPEPLPADDPLLDAPNLLVVPHIGSATVRTRSRMADMAADNLLAALAGRPMPHPAA
jgi:phosphoglycerate dehydrogenase-like enzyme